MSYEPREENGAFRVAQDIAKQKTKQLAQRLAREGTKMLARAAMKAGAAFLSSIAGYLIPIIATVLILIVMLFSYQFVADSFINAVATVKDQIMSFFGFNNANDYDPEKGEFKDLFKDEKIFNMYKDVASHWSDETEKRATFWIDPLTKEKKNMSGDKGFLERVLDLAHPHRLSHGLLAASDRLITDTEVTRWEHPELANDELADYYLTIYKGTKSEVYNDIRPRFWWQNNYTYSLSEEMRCEEETDEDGNPVIYVYKDYIPTLTPELYFIRTLSDLGDSLYMYQPVYHKQEKFNFRGTPFYSHELYSNSFMYYAAYPENQDHTPDYVYKRYFTGNEDGEHDIPTMTNVLLPEESVPDKFKFPFDEMNGKRQELEHLVEKGPELIAVIPLDAGKKKEDVCKQEKSSNPYSKTEELVSEEEVKKRIAEWSKYIEENQEYTRQVSLIFDADQKEPVSTGSHFESPRVAKEPKYEKGSYADVIKDPSYVRLNKNDIDLILSYYEGMDPMTYYEKGLLLKFEEYTSKNPLPIGTVYSGEDEGDAPRFIAAYLSVFDKGVWPVPGYTTITSPFGYRIHPITKKRSFHTGMDIGAPMGVDVVSVYDGEVVQAGYYGGYGNYVLIKHKKEEEFEDADGKKQTITYVIYSGYGHLSEIKVQNGQSVKQGQTIGLIGDTGNSTGPHLHFEIWLEKKEGRQAVNPIYFVGGKAEVGVPMDDHK